MQYYVGLKREYNEKKDNKRELSITKMNSVENVECVENDLCNIILVFSIVCNP